MCVGCLNDCWFVCWLNQWIVWLTSWTVIPDCFFLLMVINRMQHHCTMQHTLDIRIQLSCWSSTEPMWMHRMTMYVFWIVELLWCIGPVFYDPKLVHSVSHELIQFSSFWTSWQWFDDSTDCDLKIINRTELHTIAHCNTEGTLWSCWVVDQVWCQCECTGYICMFDELIVVEHLSMVATNNVTIWRNPLFEWLLLSVLIDQFDDWLNKS